MKNKILENKEIFILVIILGIFVIKNFFFKKDLSQNDLSQKDTSQKDLNYKIIHSGYIDLDETIISNIEEYNEFMEDADEWNKGYKKKISSDKYDEKFFADKSLALKFIVTGNGSTKLVSVDLTIDNNTLIVNPNIYNPHSLQDDITGDLLVVEVPKNVVNIR